MAASELNNRLDYLISYSSQLVFVCSDKIQQQSKVIESFLALQNEQADLALLTANELTPLVTYREKLFRQLVSQSQTADFNRPLNQLLASLNNHSGPILINIFQQHIVNCTSSFQLKLYIFSDTAGGGSLA